MPMLGEENQHCSLSGRQMVWASGSKKCEAVIQGQDEKPYSAGPLAQEGSAGWIGSPLRCIPRLCKAETHGHFLIGPCIHVVLVPSKPLHH